MPAAVSALSLSESHKEQLEQWVTAYGTPRHVARRCRILLAAARGQSDNSIAQELGANRKTVILWRARFARQGLKSLWETAPGRGRKPVYAAERIQAIVDITIATQGSNPVELPLVGPALGSEQVDGKQHLAEA